MPSCLVCHRATVSNDMGGVDHINAYSEHIVVDHPAVVVSTRGIGNASRRTTRVPGPLAGNDWLADSWDDLFANYDAVRAAHEGGHSTQAEVERFASAQQALVDAVAELIAQPDDPEYDGRVW